MDIIFHSSVSELLYHQTVAGVQAADLIRDISLNPHYIIAAENIMDRDQMIEITNDLTWIELLHIHFVDKALVLVESFQIRNEALHVGALSNIENIPQIASIKMGIIKKERNVLLFKNFIYMVWTDLSKLSHYNKWLINIQWVAQVR